MDLLQWYMSRTLRAVFIAGVVLITGITAFVSYYRPVQTSSDVLAEISVNNLTDPTPSVSPLPTSTPPDSPIPPIDAPTTVPSTQATVVPTSAPSTSPTPPPSSIQATELPFQTPTLRETKTGSISTYSFSSLLPNTVYKIVLPSTSADSMVISWPSETRTVRWSTEPPASLENLTFLPIDDEGDDLSQPATTLYSGLLPVPSSYSVYIYTPTALDSLTVSLLQSATDVQVFSTQTVGVYNSDAGAGYSAHGLITRDVWGASPATWDGNTSASINTESRLIWYPVYYRTARIIVHHTATAPNYSTPAAAVRAIYLYHSYIRGWGDIGYNFLIDQNGTVYQGKLGGDGTMGYHAFGAANKISLSISLIGDFSYSGPPAAQRDSLVRQLAEKSTFHGFTLKYGDGSQAKWRDPSYTLFGHRTSFVWNSGSNSWSIASTACPGNVLAGLLPSLAASAESYKTTHYSDLKQVVTAVNQSFAAQHQEGVIVVKYNVPVSTAPEIITSYLPKFSGITSYTIEGNVVTIPLTSSIVTHPDTSTEYLIPPMNWMGYDEDTPEFSTFTPAFVINGPEERAKVLLKIFKLDPRVLAADLIHTYSVNE
jgi:hypothetical protein